MKFLYTNNCFQSLDLEKIKSISIAIFSEKNYSIILYLY